MSLKNHVIGGLTRHSSPIFIFQGLFLLKQQFPIHTDTTNEIKETKQSKQIAIHHSIFHFETIAHCKLPHKQIFNNNRNPQGQVKATNEVQVWVNSWHCSACCYERFCAYSPRSSLSLINKYN